MNTTQSLDNDMTTVLPDMAICRAAYLTSRVAECFVSHPGGCPYVIARGCMYLCGHPDRNLIVGYTQRLVGQAAAQRVRELQDRE